MTLSLTMNEVEPSWPLIRYLMDDPVYYERYRTHLRTFYDNAFMQERVDRLIDKYHAMLTPFVIGRDGERPGHTFVSNDEEFSGARRWLKDYVASRRAVIEEFLR
jgi:spore coat protein H